MEELKKFIILRDSYTKKETYLFKSMTLLFSNDMLICYFLIWKVVVVGDSDVGKSNLIIRIHNGEFIERKRQTIGLDFTNVSVHESKPIRAQIWEMGNL